MIMYNFCMSNSSNCSKWKVMSPIPKLRIVAALTVLFCLLTKFFLYVKMWTKISLRARRILSGEFRARSRELSRLLIGKVLFSVAELSPMFFIAVSHFLSLYFINVDTFQVKYFIMFMYPGLSLVVLSSFTIWEKCTARQSPATIDLALIPVSQSVPDNKQEGRGQPMTSFRANFSEDAPIPNSDPHDLISVKALIKSFE